MLEKLIQEFYESELLTELNLYQMQAIIAGQGTFRGSQKHFDELVDIGIIPEFKKFTLNGIAQYEVDSYEHTIGKKGHGLKSFLCQIRFYNYNTFWRDPNLTIPQRVSNLMHGQVGGRCSCPSFLVAYSKAANVKTADLYHPPRIGQQGKIQDLWINLRPSPTWKQPSGGQPQTIDSPIINPTYVGVGCKHLRLCTTPDNVQKMVNDVMSVVGDIGKSAKQVKMQPPGKKVSPSAPKSKQASQKPPDLDPTDI